MREAKVTFFQKLNDLHDLFVSSRKRNDRGRCSVSKVRTDDGSMYEGTNEVVGQGL